jgi:hypothetical protein
MDSGDWIALAAVGSGTIVGIFGPIVTGAQRRRADHEQHTRDRRADIYIDMLVSLRRAQVAMERTAPIIGSTTDSPPLPPDEEYWKLDARVSAYGSKRMDALTDKLRITTLKFGMEAEKLATILRHENRHGTRSPLGDSADQYQKLEAIRTEARTMLEETKRQVAKELQIGLSAGADPSDRLNAWVEQRGRPPLT